MNPEDIQAVTFDVGGTLIEPWPSVGHVYADVAARHGLADLPVDVLNRQFAEAWRRRKQFSHTAAEWAAVVDETFAGLSPTPPSRSFFPELYDRFSQPAAWRVFDDALPILQRLAACGLKLGVISNWDDRLRPLLAKLGLAKFFPVTVISCEAGRSKPSPAIFASAARRLRLPPGQILHVGDSFELDVQGGEAAGFEVVQVVRTTGASGCKQIRSLHALTGLLPPPRPAGAGVKSR